MTGNRLRRITSLHFALAFILVVGCGKETTKTSGNAVPAASALGSTAARSTSPLESSTSHLPSEENAVVPGPVVQNNVPLAPAPSSDLLAVPTTTSSEEAPEASDPYTENLQKLTSTIDSEVQQAAEWFAELPFDPARQLAISQAINALDRDSVRSSAIPLLPVWGTSENVAILGNLLKQERFDRADCLRLAERIGDDRLIEPLIAVLADPFDDGKLAEQILIGWGATADMILVTHANNPNDEIHQRILRIAESRKIPPEVLARQCITDLRSLNADQRRYAAQWLEETKCAAVSEELHFDLIDAALPLLDDENKGMRFTIVEIIGWCADEKHNDQYVELLNSEQPEHRHAAVRAVARTGNVKAAKVLSNLITDEQFAGTVCGALRSTGGAPAEELAIAILRQPVPDNSTGHLAVAMTLGDIGGTKSVAVLRQLMRKERRNANLVAAINVALQKIGNRMQTR